jgi:hypothetical protein
VKCVQTGNSVAVNDKPKDQTPVLYSGEHKLSIRAHSVDQPKPLDISTNKQLEPNLNRDKNQENGSLDISVSTNSPVFGSTPANYNDLPNSSAVASIGFSNRKSSQNAEVSVLNEDRSTPEVRFALIIKYL